MTRGRAQPSDPLEPVATSAPRCSTVGMLATLLVVAVSGCAGLTEPVRDNSRAITESIATISANTEAVGVSTRQLGDLAADLEALDRLEAPLRQVADLRESLERVAALSQPMSELQSLRASLEALDRLEPSLRATAALREPMQRVASLHAALDEVAGLEPQLAAVAALGPRLEEVARLEASLQRVAALEASLARVADLGTALEPWRDLGPQDLERLLSPRRMVLPLALLGLVITIATAIGVALGTRSR